MNFQRKIKRFRLSFKRDIGEGSRIRSNEISLRNSSIRSNSMSKQKRNFHSLSPRPATERPYIFSKGI